MIGEKPGGGRESFGDRVRALGKLTALLAVLRAGTNIVVVWLHAANQKGE